MYVHLYKLRAHNHVRSQYLLTTWNFYLHIRSYSFFYNFFLHTSEFMTFRVRLEVKSLLATVSL